MFKKVYVEITNRCNLRCSFCPGTAREGRAMTEAEFRLAAGKLRGHTEYLYFHLMGEPLTHPELGALLAAADELGFRAVVTTNGTLLPAAGGTLLGARALHRVNVSLQSYEANPNSGELGDYAGACADFAREAAARGKLCSLRLWNGGGAEEKNGEIRALLRSRFPGEWKKGRFNEVLADGVFLEYGDSFDWPAASSPEREGGVFCRGLRDHIGVLCDGTVVPCCLDSEGTMALGNLFREELSDILASPRARAIYDGFSRREAAEGLCRRCGYSRRFG